MATIIVIGPNRAGERPLWRAEVEFVQERLPLETPSVRSLFLNRAPAFYDESGQPFLPPNTRIALCLIHYLEINLGDHTYSYRRTDVSYVNPTLMLLQASPDDWKMVDGEVSQPVATCLAGEIPLHLFAVMPFGSTDPNPWAKHFENLREPTDVRLNASGIALRADAVLPWEETPIRGSYQILLPFPARAGEIQMVLDSSLRDAEAQTNFRRAFQRLTRALRPAEAERPLWAGLELAAEATLPQFYWAVQSSVAGPGNYTFQFGREALQVLLTEPALTENGAPRSLCRTLPEQVVLRKQEQIEVIGEQLVHVQELTLTLSSEAQAASLAPEADASLYRYTARRDESSNQWREELYLSNLTTAYDAVQVAAMLREQAGQEAPDPSLASKNPALLWGFTPLEDGWAHLPFFNVTEQLYLNVFQPTAQEQSPTIAPPRLIGAFSAGLDSADLAARQAGEQPWNVTLLDATQYSGEWKLTRRLPADAMDAPWQLQKASLLFLEPEVALNGFFWLATDRPSAADALPSLDDWLGGLRMVALRTLLPEETFPAPFVLEFENLTLMLDRTTRRPALSRWQFLHAANMRPYHQRPDGSVFATLATKGPWTAAVREKLWQELPLVWRRHPFLPTIQTLPLTQIQVPPNYPSPSRQLAPFELPVQAEGEVEVPARWLFGVAADSGARAWPQLLNPDEAPPAREWRSAGLLWLASLSVPGLAFDPRSEDAPLTSTVDFLPARYQHHLPYTDEPNALAQLPRASEKERPPNEQTPQLAPVLPLQRADYARFWDGLSERAFLALPAGTDALTRDANGELRVDGLAEPFVWPVQAELQEAAYPGALSLRDAGNAPPLQLTEAAALRGIEGRFALVDGHLQRVSTDADNWAFELIAGSLNAVVADGRARDQHGLWRAATQTPTSQLLRTPVQREGEAPLSLCSLLEPLSLNIGEVSPWQLWFRDLPVREQTFVRTDTRSDLASGVNDPAATSAAFAPLTGYEWRLGNRAANAPPFLPLNAPPFLPLLSFHFYPLTLEEVIFTGDEVTAVEMIGRLQLPDNPPAEQRERHNAVRVRFDNTEGALRLAAISIAEPEPTSNGETTELPLEWPLSTNEFTATLLCSQLRYDATKMEVIAQVQLEFSLFDVRWTLPPRELKFPEGMLAFTAEQLEAANSEAAAQVTEVILVLAATGNHLTVGLAFRWAGENITGVTAIGTLELLGDTAGTATFEAILRQKDRQLSLTTTPEGAALSLRSRVVQFSFTAEKPSDQAQFHLLPGMRLSGAEPLQGFAVLAFAVTEQAGMVPAFRLLSASLETLLPCEWGSQLQEATPETPQALERVCGSSAGRLYGGYTLVAERQKDESIKWIPGLLLNGFLELKNLISWPLEPGRQLGAAYANPLTIPFDVDQYSPPLEADELFKQAADLLRAFPNLTLKVEGHNDNHGDEQYKNDLSLSRAQAVREVFLHQYPEFSIDRLPIIGYGDARPVRSNDTPAGQAANRRVELVPKPLYILPALRPAEDRPALHHLRHTMRVLFNQHEVPPDVLMAGTSGVLFDLAEQRSWQLLAVVEHQLIDVYLNDAQAEELAVTSVTHDRRWTAVQEVRLLRPPTLRDFLRELSTSVKYNTLDPQQQIAPLTQANQGYHRAELLQLLLDDPLLAGESEQVSTLLVEASATHWVSLQENTTGQFTNVQYLPHGIQRAILSQPEDFAVEETESRSWFLLSLPFLGRLQLTEEDRIARTARGRETISALRVDPILLLDQQRRARRVPSALSLALASWEDKESRSVVMTEFDLAGARRWGRLDPASLVESWYRLQYPPEENAMTNFASVMAALPEDSPGKLGRPAALASLHEAWRSAIPARPRHAADPAPEQISAERELVWRRHNLFALQGVSDNEDAPTYSFIFTGAQLHTSGLSGVDNRTVRHTSATLIPANLLIEPRFENREPVSLAVSPFLGLEFQQLQGGTLQLTVAELLCLDPNRLRLDVVASQVWQATDGTDANLQQWGRAAHQRLASDSPVALLRIRRVREGGAGVVIEYQFTALTVTTPSSPVRRARRVRAPLEALRFTEGQFGGTQLPSASAVLNFEVAPPQTHGAQALYLETRPGDATARPWGFSGVRFSVQYVQDGNGLVGSFMRPAEFPNLKLWWSALAHAPQFALHEPTGRRKLLPHRFRAEAMQSFLSAPPRLPLPAGRALNLSGPGSTDYWQPILPGSLHYLVVGGRAGAMYSFRHHLLCLEISWLSTRTNAFASGSVVVQQRLPRPVSLPNNDPNHVELALRPWASRFDPVTSVRVTFNPADNALLEGDTPSGFAMQLLGGGMLRPNFNGALIFELIGAQAEAVLAAWEFKQVTLLAGNRHIEFPTMPLVTDNKYLKFDLNDAALEALHQAIASFAHGEIALVQVNVSAKATAVPGRIQGYSQTLTFALRIAQEQQPYLPLRPVFLQFEDPEYNRRLASLTARGTANINVGTARYEIVLAADRREYNPTTPMLVVFFADEGAGLEKADLLIEWLDAAAVRRKFPVISLQRNRLCDPINLAEQSSHFGTALAPGHFLQLTLKNDAKGVNISFRVNIVGEPVQPAAEAGYALLRQRDKAVACARFAWGPLPSRIELTNPDDLKQTLVRRRAVFQWLDTIRLDTTDTYYLHKLTVSGGQSIST